ncbi:MAG: hypothetical protein LKE53_10645 [Oscillospiraceae bacterium]|nr:hypothetical protein [Oscillospiraceae bacterium]MDD3260388.1 hypothetical protein [Oscillospiraceae bacterium]
MNAQKMISLLTPEIDRKCEQIQQARKEKTQVRLFVLLCAAALIIPTVFVFFGISLAAILTPVLFLAAAFLLLSPILIRQQGGEMYEQARKTSV